FFQAEDGIRDKLVTGVQTCALPIWPRADGVAGFFLQRDLLLLRARPGPLLRRAVGRDRVVHAALRARQFHGAAAARAAVRHARRSEERRVGKECRSRGWREE